MENKMQIKRLFEIDGFKEYAKDNSLSLDEFPQFFVEYKNRETGKIYSYRGIGRNDEKLRFNNEDDGEIIAIHMCSEDWTEFFEVVE